MPRFNDVQVASGYDQTLSDSDNIEDYTPASGEQFRLPGIGLVYCAVGSDPDYSPGQLRIAADGTSSYVGFPQSRYMQDMCHVDTLSDLRTNLEGAVTANIRTQGTTYAEYNCQLRFEWQKRQDRYEWYTVTWIFTIIEAI